MSTMPAHELLHHWQQGRLSRDETITRIVLLLAGAHSPPASPPTPQPAPAGLDEAASLLCARMLQQLSETLDELAARGLVLWQDDARLWHWRWEDSPCRAPHGMRTLGVTLTEALEQRFPEIFLPPELRG